MDLFLLLLFMCYHVFIYLYLIRKDYKQSDKDWYTLCFIMFGFGTFFNTIEFISKITKKNRYEN